MLELNGFINKGVKDIADTAGRFYLGNRKGQGFMLRMASALHKSTKTREKLEKDGTHVPPFLIASIATRCNLSCAGCYARANGGCGDAEKPQGEEMSNSPSTKGKQIEELAATDWERIFSEASEIGISFILLAGGEPLLRRDIIEMASRHKNIFFPIFTNGTLIGEDYLQLFDEHRNLIPVLSIEGDECQTDERRGEGVAEAVWSTAELLKQRGILYGTSITVTSENKNDVTTGAFVRDLRERGCGLVFYVEYVPVEEGTDHLLLSEEDLQVLQQKVDALREDKQNKGMILLSFPGDEDAMGGCLAAGRGFFHINANGAAEPCPFSPFSEMSLQRQSLLEVLRSDFFKKVREISAAEALNHKGGCTLFQYEEDVKQALA
jgi:MoaA/NifB/PqqE/SkfB family radical SAM enzyme